MKLYEQFKQKSKAFGSQTAIVCEDRQYAYEDMQEAIDRFKETIEKSKKSNEKEMVLLALSRGEEVIWGQLAANGAGQGFAMMDAREWGSPRGQKMIEAIDPGWIVTESQEGPMEGYETIGLIGRWNAWRKKQEGRKYRQEVSHIIFSSGSTGDPKGIMLKEIPLLRVIEKQSQILGVKANHRWAWVLNPCFDASLSDTYVCLLNGGELHACTFDQTKIKTFRNYCHEHAIEYTDCSPSILGLIKPEDFRSLKGMVFGGEVANEKAVKSWAKKIQLWNAYGPTETSVCCAMKKVDSEWQEGEIGSIFEGLDWKIQEEELWLSGEALAVGYLKEEQTQKAFIKEDHQYWYKTGDRVELLSNGELRFKGRMNRIMKHHGVWVSLDEVEAIARQEGAYEARCDWKEEEGKKKLRLRFTGTGSEEEMKGRFLKRGVGEAWMPKEWVKVKEWDRNGNGKIK